MSPRSVSMNKLVFFIAIIIDVVFGLYVLLDWGLAYGWIGIILIVSGLGVFTAFFNRILAKSTERST
jgi:hypothetical protein